MVDLGRLGEIEFEKLCTEEGLVPNKAHNDKMGWDYVVEFPIQSTSAVFRDESGPPLQFKAQIKATQSKSRFVDISLSVMERLVKETLPTFVILFTYNKNAECKGAFLHHVGQQTIASTLKRLRQWESDQKQSRLGKMSHRINFSNDDFIPVSSMKLLFEKITEATSPFQTYGSRKQAIINSVGFEDGNAEIKFEVTEYSGLDSLIDAALGLRESAQVYNVEGFRKRFQILSPDPLLSSETAQLSFPNLKPSQKGRLLIRKGKTGPAATLNADIFTTPLAFVNGSIRKFRVKSALLDFAFEPTASAGRFTIDLTEAPRCSLKEARESLKLLCLDEHYPNGAFVEIVNDNGARMHFRIKAFERMAFAPYFLSLVRKLEVVFDHLSIDKDLVHLNIFEIEQHEKEISVLHSVASNLHLDSMTIRTPVQLKENDRISACIPAYPQFGTLVVGCSLVVDGIVLRVEDDEYKIQITSVGAEAIICEEELYLDISAVQSQIASILDEKAQDGRKVLFFEGKLNTNRISNV